MFTHASMKAHTVLHLDSDWFFFPFYNPFSASRHLTKSPIVYFIIRRIQACASPGEHVIDWLYHPAIIFTLYSLVDAPALNHQQATPHPLFFSLSLILFKHPTHCKRSSVLENYILWHQFQFSLQCQVSLTHSIFRLVSKWHHKSINVSMIVCVWGGLRL